MGGFYSLYCRTLDPMMQYNILISIPGAPSVLGKHFSTANSCILFVYAPKASDATEHTKNANYTRNIDAENIYEGRIPMDFSTG